MVPRKKALLVGGGGGLVTLYILCMCEYQCDTGVTKNDTREVIHHCTAVK